ncbi:MAG: hypothetical protein LQ346_008864 [Caloplaca aetnensis]|nr:MAG: hypothetical protein LQ346_008864 [Caloplaca aetnensis]
MLLHLVALLTLQLVATTLALPVTPPNQDVNGNLVLPGLPDDTSSSVVASTFGPLGTPGKRPGGDRLLPPENDPGKWHVLFNRYGKDIRKDDGAVLFAKALSQVEDWIRAARRHAETPVEEEHIWTQGSLRLKISKPNWLTSYTLGDLQKYIEIMIAFHAKYEVYWEWHATLIIKGRWGSANAVGSGKLEIL